MFFSHTTPHISQSITLANTQPLKIVMGEDTQTLEEVVVTALGIKREQKALSYNVQLEKLPVSRLTVVQQVLAVLHVLLCVVLNPSQKTTMPYM